MNNFLIKVKTYPKFGLVILAYIAFIALGMPDGLLGVAWPSIREGFGIPLDALGSLLFVSTSGYLLSSFLSGKVIAHIGVGKLLAISCALTGIAMVGYTLVPNWWIMVMLGIFAGLGAGAIDAGLNTYVAANFGEGLMQWLHASYGIGITSGPLIMTMALNSFQSWRIGYIIVGAFQFILAVSFALTLPMWTRGASAIKTEQPVLLTDYKTPILETLKRGRVWLSVLQFFLYTGSEVAVGTWTYSFLTEVRGVNPEAAGLWTGSYWAMFTVGRVLAGLYAKRLGVNKLIISSLLSALLGAVLLWWNPLMVINLLAVGLIGLAIAPIFPGLVSGTSKRVGERFAVNTIGMQMAAASLGVALIPSLIGVLARWFSLEIIPVCLIVLFALQLGLYWVNISTRRNVYVSKNG